MNNSTRYAMMLATLLALNVPSASYAEYLIYLKGGHYIAADNCTFSARRERSVKGDAEKEDATMVRVEDCAKQETGERLVGQIFWSTIDGKFGEVNADEVYYIHGSRGLPSISPQRQAKPLEDYLIISRGESFINAKVVGEGEGRVYGVKRDDLADINRRAVTEIVPAADAKSRSGEGLCPGERAEFDVSDTEYVLDHLFVGFFKNLSRDSCMDLNFDVEVKKNERFIDKFEIKESSDRRGVPAGGTKRFSAEVPSHLREYVKLSRTSGGGVQLCWTKALSLAQCEADRKRRE